jgi:hypothetical protein
MPAMRSAGLTTALALLAIAAPGCGKSNLKSARVLTQTSTAQTSTASTQPQPQSATREATPPAKHSLQTPTPAQAAAFAHAVDLQLADLPGAHGHAHASKEERSHEAQECATGVSGAVGGAESPRFTRGKGLAREVISSGVAVLASSKLATKDLLGVTSKAGVACYAKVVKHSLSANEDGLRLRSVRVARVVVPVTRTQKGIGIRAVVTVTSTDNHLSVPIYIDAVVLVYRQAELELYASSYVQPEPSRTEQELLSLMVQRARRTPL